VAAPAVAGTTEGGLTSAGTSLPVTLPAGGASTDGYLVIVAKGSGAVTINALADWTEIVDAATAADLAFLWYTGTGVPANPTFVQSGSSRSVWCAYRITGTSRSRTPTIGTIATGSSVNPNPPSASVTGGPLDILAIACFAGAGELADNDSLVTTFPTNYSSGQVEKTGGIGGSNLAGILGSAARQVTGASSEDPGTFTLGTSRAWRAQTIIVYPLAPSYDQSHFRWRNDDNGEAAASWIDAEDVDISRTTAQLDTNIRLRVVVQEQGVGQSISFIERQFRVLYSKNGGAVNDITGASSVARSSASPHVADGAATTEQLSGTGSFVDGYFKESDTTGTLVTAMPVSGSSEIEICFQLRSADLVAGDTVDFIVLDLNYGSLAAQSQIPRVTITSAGGTDHEVPIDDTLSLSDSIAISRANVLADTLGLADALTMERAVALLDSIGLSDSLSTAKGVALAIDDTLALADLVDAAKIKAVQIDDTLSLADLLTTAAEKTATINDSVTLSDAIVFDRNVVILDNVSLADAIAKTFGISLSDSLALADAIDAVHGRAHEVLIVDSVAISDFITTELGGTPPADTNRRLIYIRQGFYRRRGRSIEP
jgi:hypothetical protein